MDSGTLVNREPKHDDYASAALTLVNVTNTTRLLGGEKEKELLDFCLHILNVKIYLQIHFTVASQFYVYVNVELYLHAFIHFYGGKKNRRGVAEQ